MKDEEVRELIKAEVARAVATLPGGRTVYMPAPEVIRLEYQQRALERLMEFVVTIIPEQRAILRFMLGQDRAVTPGQIGAGIGLNNIQVGNALKRMKSANLVSQGGAAGGGSAYRPRIREWVASQLAPHSPTDADVEDVYQAVLGRLAGEVVVG